MSAGGGSRVGRPVATFKRGEDRPVLLFSDVNMSRDTLFVHPIDPSLVFVHPRSIVLAYVELEAGLTYAQRSTMRAIVLAARRMCRVEPTFEALRERTRHLDGVKP